ncbi:helix-turn-helix domain-containing protein [Nocardioides piscis]|uniref:Helix-turn-helix domain-containing protein n=1 Tax=Nocardioides piscis TaxID=2714938 RepID=A0A6G7YCT6_9ACTN|nr:helix-turn-helix domain-containing protein [Nocardioides piscis]QIK74580.1 helix-turn-helix domain-containing protein [Nocardioides piscis]
MATDAWRVPPETSLPDPADIQAQDLGPRVWWMYVALDSPRTVTELAAESGLAESSVRAHLRTLGRFPLVRQSPDAGQQGTYLQAVTLSEALREQVEAKVAKAGMALPAASATTQSSPRVMPPPAPTSGSGASRSDASASSRRTWLWVAAVASCVLGLVVFLQLSQPDDDTGTERPTTAETATPTPSASTPTRPRRRPSRTPTAEAPPPAPASNTSLDEKADRLAAIYGYTLASDPPGTGAGLAQTTCSRAADGWDYEEAVADDISVGAPESVAVDWNSFVYEEYCPAY